MLKLYLKKDRFNYKIISRGKLWYDMCRIERINEVDSIIKYIQNGLCISLGNTHKLAYLEKLIGKNRLNL